MFTYLVIILLTTLFSWMSIHIKDKRLRIIFGILTVLFPSIMAGIRYGIGTDYSLVYEPYFNNIQENNILFSEDRFEIGYRIINIIVANILNLDFSWVMFIMSFITNYCVYKSIYDLKDKINLPVAIFTYMMLYYQMSFNLVRQCCAMAISLYAFKFLNKKLYKYFLCIFIGALFQKTVAILFVIPIVKKIYMSKEKKYVILKYTSYIVLILLIFNFKYIYDIFKNNELIGYYVRSYLRTTEADIGIGAIIRVVPFLIPIIFLDKKTKDDEIFRLIYSMFILGSILRLFAYITTTFAERLALYFTIMQVFLVGYYFKNIKKYKVIINTLLIITVMFFWYYDFIYIGMNETVPYVTIFSK